MTTTVIYLWGIADDLNNAAAGIWAAAFFLAAALLLISFFFQSENQDKEAAAAMTWAKRSLAIGLAFLAAWVFIPSSKTIAAMVVIPAIAQSDVIKRDLPEIYSAAVNKLKEELGIKEAEQPK